MRVAIVIKCVDPLRECVEEVANRVLGTFSKAFSNCITCQRYGQSYAHMYTRLRNMQLSADVDVVVHMLVRVWNVQQPLVGYVHVESVSACMKYCATQSTVISWASSATWEGAHTSMGANLWAV